MAWFSTENALIPEIIALNSRWLQGKPALEFAGAKLTWREFGTRTSQVANALLDSGLQPGDRVVVLMRNSASMAESLFGIIRAGMVVVPLNVSVDDAAIQGMIDDSEASAVIASDEHIDRIEKLKSSLSSKCGQHLIGVNTKRDGWLDFESFIREADTKAPQVKIVSGDECNIIYSSGTTGIPKGIVHDHGCRANWATDMAIALRYHGGARTLVNLGLYSNISWVAMLATILSGGTLVISPAFSAGDCLRMIEDHSISHFAMVPVQFQRLLEFEHFEQYDLSSLHATMCCGSPLAPSDKMEIMQRIPGDFIELYGLTEGLVTTLDPEFMADKTDSVGRPCPGQDIKILDDEGNELPTGTAGEIVGFGRLLMSGYHRNDSENEIATWTDPSGKRWLRTGDIGQLDEDGFLHLVDRKKDMIISGGQNVYPADIEAVLNTHQDISEVAVIGVSSKKWGETPMAIVVPASDCQTEPLELTEWANSKLGRQQKITATVFVNELPRNPNGKILKHQLRSQYQSLEL